MLILPGYSLANHSCLSLIAHSKWPEVEIMSSTTSEKTIDVLRTMFARYGLPLQLVTDNGPQFISSELQEFFKANRMKHILSAPYHPASKGQVERFVQTLKCFLKTSDNNGKTLGHRLAEFLFVYQATPRATTYTIPSDLFLRRKLRTRFDLMMPNTKEYVTSKKAEQKWRHVQYVKDIVSRIDCNGSRLLWIE